MTGLAEWDVDPDKWPRTPPLDVWRALYADDDNWPWRAGIGHVVNVLDEALDRLEAADAALARVRALADEWEATAQRFSGIHAEMEGEHAARLRVELGALAGDGEAGMVPEAARNGAVGDDEGQVTLGDHRDDEGRSGAQDGSGRG